MSDLLLLYPEWQSYGESTCVYHGARKLAAALFQDKDVYEVEVPEDEQLDTTKGVLGLDSIAPRFRHTLEVLRTRSPRRVFMVGGTCGVEVAPVSYLNELYSGGLAVIWFDAHGDLNTPESSPSGHFHGMGLRTLLGEGPLEYTTQLRRPLRSRQIFLAGPRDLDPAERAFIMEHDICVASSDELRNSGRLSELVRGQGFRNAYVHLDLDVINPESFPDSLMRTPGGPSLEEVQRAIRELSTAVSIVGFSIVEYCEHTGGALERLIDLTANSGVTIGVSQPSSPV